MVDKNFSLVVHPYFLFTLITMNINAFDTLSNEVISNIILYLDAASLFKFCGCSRQLKEFNVLTNERWKTLYSIQWLVDEQELDIYEGK